MKIAICLPPDRDDAGTLRLIAADGVCLFGPVAAAGRAQTALARMRGNPTRNPLHPYGDTACGAYTARIDLEQRIIRLEPRSGQAALADANGRFSNAILGDEGETPGALRATAGAVRLFNADLDELLAFLEHDDGSADCEILESEERTVETYDDPRPPHYADPPDSSSLSARAGSFDAMTRRAALAATAVLGLAGATIFSRPASAQTPPLLLTQYTPEPTATPACSNAMVTLNVTENPPPGTPYVFTVYNSDNSETCSGFPGNGSTYACSVEVACGDGYRYIIKKNGTQVRVGDLGTIDGPRSVSYP